MMNFAVEGNIERLVNEYHFWAEMHRPCDRECYLKDDNLTPERAYTYMHWKAENVLCTSKHPRYEVFDNSRNLNYLLSTYTGHVHRWFPAEISDLRLGEVVLRILEYPDTIAHTPHCDISYLTMPIASVMTDGEIVLHDHSKFWRGYQSEFVGHNGAVLHKINRNRCKYSVVLFVNLHFSVYLPLKGKYVGEFLTENCYG